MSYSRWGGRGSGHWYTYWHVQDYTTENRDTAIFDIFTVTTFTAKQLRDDMDGCMAKVRRLDANGDTKELRKYAMEFLADVDDKYPRKKVTEKQLIKENALLLAEHHKKYCEGEKCNISLYLLRRALDLAGIELDDKEKRKFM
jgi:hypothetical protein